MDADKAQIADVLIRYATGIDSKNWELFRTCWTDEVDLDYGEVGHFTDPDAITDLFAQSHNPMGPTYHRLSNFAIDVDGDRRPRGPTYTPCSDDPPDDTPVGSRRSATTTTNSCDGADGWRIRVGSPTSRGC